MLGLKRGIVELCDHEKSWEENADKTIKQLKSILGSAATDIQHVGSTSIVHIKAKPIIDIAVAVNDFDNVKKLIPVLEEQGFYYSSKNMPEEMFFTCGDFTADIKTHHIHVVKAESDQWLDYINFRDYLNENNIEANEYEELKMRLMKKYKHDRLAYTEGKAEFILHTLRKVKNYSPLGKSVTVIIDRPMGSVHPEYKNIVYPVNYGYIEGITAPDGEEQDAYVLGVNNPLKNFKGIVTAVIERENDIENKWVVVPEIVHFDQAEIMEAVYFQEKYFKTTINNIYHKSVGMIIFRKNQDKIEYLLLFQPKSRTWSFPKGHKEIFENELQTAMREVKEETKLEVEVIPGFKEGISYSIGLKYHKTVILFLAEMNGEIKIKNDEISKFRWVKKNDACKLLVHSHYSEIIDKAERKILNKNRKY